MRNFLFGAIFLCLFFSVSGTEIKTEPSLANWSKRGRKAAFADQKTSLSGCSIRLENDARISCEIPVNPDTEYVVTFYIKGENISSRKEDGARFAMYSNGRWLRFTSDGARPDNGTFDWRRVSGKFNTRIFRADVKKATIQLMLRGKGKVWFDKITVTPRQTEKGKSFRQDFAGLVEEAAFFPRGVAGFFDPGKPVELQLLISGKIGQSTCRYTVKNISGKTIFSGESKPFSPAKGCVIKVPGQPEGYYTVEADIFSNGKKVYFIESAFAVNKAPRKRDPFFQFGIGVYPELFEGYKRVGAGSISIKLKYDLKNCTPEQLVERAVKTHEKFINSDDFYLTASIGSSLRREWFSGKELAAGAPLMQDRYWKGYAALTEGFARKTKGRIREWTMQTEIPSNASMPKFCNTWSEAVANFVVVCRISSRAVKKVDPAIKFWAGGCNNRDYYSPYEEIALTDLRQDIDGLLIDAYTGNWNLALGNYLLPEQELRNFYQQVSDFSFKLGKGRIIRNEECGYCINYGCSYRTGISREQARLTIRSMILTKASPVMNYELHMPSYLYGKYGNKDWLMTTIWRPVRFNRKIYHVPMPGGAAYAAAAQELAFVKLHKLINYKDFYAAVFTRPDNSVVAAVWNTAENRSLLLRLQGNPVSVSLFGSIAPLKNGLNTLEIGPDPVYIKTSGKPEVLTAELERQFAIQSPRFSAAGKRHSPDKVRIFVQNNGQKVENIKLISGKNTVSRRLLPGSPGEFLIPYDKEIFLQADDFRMKVPIDEKFIRVKRLAAKPVFDGSGSWLKGMKPGLLKYPENILPKKALQPELGYFKTSFSPDRHNISAEYFLGYDLECLYLAVRVNDPKHVPGKRYQWNGDALQFALTDKNAAPASVRLKSTPASKFAAPCNFGIALTPRGTEAVSYRQYPAIPANIRALATHKNAVTLYEAAIPWRETGFSPEKAGAIRLGMVIFDNNTPGTDQSPYYLALTAGVASVQDIAEYRLLVFEK